MTQLPWESPGVTALIVPASEAEPVVGPLRRRHTQDGSEGVPAHVTLISPFAPAPALPALLPQLEAVIATWRAAPFVLRHLRRWPGIVWLDPEPSAPFVAMTEALAARFPDYPPYEGAHADVIPHVTVATRKQEDTLDEVAAQVERALPIACSGDTVQLIRRGEDRRWRERQSWRLR
jgi:2'-5' RNA ligase